MGGLESLEVNTFCVLKTSALKSSELYDWIHADVYMMCSKYASFLLQKRLLDSDFIDPLMNKKPRISHLTNRVQPTLNDHLTNSGEKNAEASPPPPPAAVATPAALPLPPTCLSVSNPPRTVNSNSNSPSTPEGRGTQDLPVDTLSQNGSIYEDQHQKYTTRTPLEIPAPTEDLSVCPKSTDEKRLVLHKKSKKKSKKHKEKDQIKEHSIENIAEKAKDCENKEIAKLKNSSLNFSEGIVIFPMLGQSN